MTVMTSLDFEAVLEASGAAVAVLDTRSTVTFATSAFRARSGIAQADQAGLTIRHASHGDAHITWTRGEVKYACRLNSLPCGSLALTLLGAALGPADARAAAVLLEDLWGLTPAESDIAWHHARGASLPEIASARRVSVETVRTQMRAVRDKAGAVNGRVLQSLYWAALASPCSEQGS
jgi:DNA-binding CsgD family transcriptional regulator